MSVYVDALVPAKVRGVRATSWCQMIADTEEELHAMAAQVGLRREWFQTSPPASSPHYDLVPSRRAKAVRLGAVECDRATFVQHVRRMRAERRVTVDVIRVPQLELPGGNVREHPMARSRRVKKERYCVRMCLLKVRAKPTLPLVVVLTRCGTGLLDDDNAAFAVKGARDEIADWLGLPNDRDPRVRFVVKQQLVRRENLGLLVAFEPCP